MHVREEQKAGNKATGGCGAAAVCSETAAFAVCIVLNGIELWPPDVYTGNSKVVGCTYG